MKSRLERENIAFPDPSDILKCSMSEQTYCRLLKWFEKCDTALDSNVPISPARKPLSDLLFGIMLDHAFDCALSQKNDIPPNTKKNYDDEIKSLLCKLENDDMYIERCESVDGLAEESIFVRNDNPNDANEKKLTSRPVC